MSHCPSISASISSSLCDWSPPSSTLCKLGPVFVYSCLSLEILVFHGNISQFINGRSMNYFKAHQHKLRHCLCILNKAKGRNDLHNSFGKSTTLEASVLTVEHKTLIMSSVSVSRTVTPDYFYVSVGRKKCWKIIRALTGDRGRLAESKLVWVEEEEE